MLAAGGQAPGGDVAFTPEIEHGGSYYPVCGIGFWDSNEGASALCHLSGYRSGGTAVRTNVIYAKDAMPIGSCSPGGGEEDVESCYGDVTSFGGAACAAGNPVGVQVVCNEQVIGNMHVSRESVE